MGICEIVLYTLLSISINKTVVVPNIVNESVCEQHKTMVDRQQSYTSPNGFLNQTKGEFYSACIQVCVR